MSRVGLVIGSLLLSVEALACPVSIDLSGVWKVAGTNFNGTAKLPGTLAAASLGKRWSERDFQVTMDLPQSEALVQEWQYVGKAVWTREITLSESDCRTPMELNLERVMWKSAAFWDGQPLGERDSLATAHVYALPRLTPGKHLLRLEIDNSCFYGFSRQSHAYGPNMQAVWNGVLGRVELRERNDLRSVRVFAEAPANRRLIVEVPDSFEATPTTLVIDGLGYTVVGHRSSSTRAGWQLVELSLAAEPECWSPDRPRLYTLTLTDSRTRFVQALRFGFCTPGTRGRALTLNGQPIFMRGNVENANFAKDGTPWMTKAEWVKMLMVLKSEDGCNAIRFHTWCPPQAAFDAADEVGMLLLPEAGIWTDRWMSDGDPVGNGKPVDGFVRRELDAIADAYGNSPSFFSLAIGNELGNSNFPEMGKMIESIRRHDPRRLYYASSARQITKADDFHLTHQIPGKGLCREKLLPRTDWDYEDVYSAATIPTVAHEIGQWPVYPVWAELLAPFTGTMRPWNLSRHRDTAVKKNTIRFQHEYHTASALLNRLIYKAEVESFLRTPSCAGLQLLEVQDYTGQAEALVGWRDPFYALKPGFAKVPPFSKVWGPVSFLARFPRFTYEVGERFVAELQVRNSTASVIPAGTAYPYALGDRCGKLTLAKSVAPGEIAAVGRVECELTTAMTTSKQTLSFGSNQWNFWVYPKAPPTPTVDGLVETRDLPSMQRALAEGKTVLYTGPSWKSAKGTFKPVYWSARWFPVANTTAAALGTWFDVKHPVFAKFTTEAFTDWQWYSLSEGATIHALKEMPADYRPFALSVNDFHFCDLTSPMFEVLVGDGRLFVCGYDLSAATPEARQLRSSILAYLASRPADNTPRMTGDWLQREFGGAVADSAKSAIYDCATNLTGRVISAELRGLPPTTGEVVLDFTLTSDTLTSGRGLVEDRLFEVPFASAKGETVSVRIPVIREDFLDGKLAIEAHVMTGNELSLRRIRLVAEKPKVSPSSPEITWSIMHPVAIDVDYMRRVVAKAKEYGHVDSFELCGLEQKGINALSLFEKYPHAHAKVDRQFVEKTRADLNAVCELAHAAGKPIVFWHRENLVPKGIFEDVPALLDSDGEFDLLGDAYGEYLRYKIGDVFKNCPKLDGLVLTLTESEYSVLHNSNQQRYPAVQVVRNLVGIFTSELGKRGKRFILRSFGDGSDHDMIINGALAASQDSGVKFEIETKVTEADFVPWLPCNPYLKRDLPLALGAECDALGEFLGAGHLPAAQVGRIREYVESARKADAGRFAIRIDRKGTSIFDTAHEINLYAYMRFIRDPKATEDEVIAEYSSRHFGRAAAAMAPVLKDELEMVRNINYVASNLTFHAFPIAPDFKYLKAGGIFSLYHAGKSLEDMRPIWSIFSWMTAPTHAQILAEKANGVLSARRGLAAIEAMKADLPPDEYRRQRRAFENAVTLSQAVEAYTKGVVAYFEDMADGADEPKRLNAAIVECRAVFARLRGSAIDREYLDGIGFLALELPREYALERAMRKALERPDVYDFVIPGGIYDDGRVSRLMHAAYPVTKDDCLVRFAGNTRFPIGRIAVKLRAPKEAKIEVSLDPSGSAVADVQKSWSNGVWQVSIGKRGSGYPAVRSISAVK